MDPFIPISCKTEREALYHYQLGKLDGKKVTILRNADNSGYSVVPNSFFDAVKRLFTSSGTKLSDREISQLTSSQKYEYQTFITEYAHKNHVSAKEAIRVLNNRFIDYFSEEDLPRLQIRHALEMNAVLSILPTDNEKQFPFKPGLKPETIVKELAGESPSDNSEILRRYYVKKETNPVDSEQTKWRGAVIDYLKEKYGITDELATKVLDFKLNNNLPTLHIAFARYLLKENIVPSINHAVKLLRGYQGLSANNNHLGNLLCSGVQPQVIHKLLSDYPTADLELYNKIITDYEKHIQNYAVGAGGWSERLLEDCYCHVVTETNNQVDTNNRIDKETAKNILQFYRQHKLTTGKTMDFVQAKKAYYDSIFRPQVKHS